MTRISILKYKGKTYFEKIKGHFPPFSLLRVLGVVFIAMALKANSILSRPWQIFDFLIPLAILYTLNFVICTFIARKFFSYSDGVAFIFASVMRNLSIALAMAMTLFKTGGEEIAIILAFAYIIQVQAGAFYAKFIKILLRPKECSLEELDCPGLEPLSEVKN